jgi:energy-converting hydrogenase Eha subunit A
MNSAIIEDTAILPQPVLSLAWHAVCIPVLSPRTCMISRLSLPSTCARYSALLTSLYSPWYVS